MADPRPARSASAVPSPAPTSPAPPPAFDLAAAYDAHGGALLGFAINALRDRGLAEDCVQETFLRAWRSREQYDHERASVRTWLFVIARNVVVDVHRSIQRTPHLVSADVLEETVGENADPLDDLTMAEGLARLSEEHRSVVVAVHLQGVSYAELSARTGVAVPTLRTRAFYALKALRGHLAEPPPPPRPAPAAGRARRSTSSTPTTSQKDPS